PGGGQSPRGKAPAGPLTVTWSPGAGRWDSFDTGAPGCPRDGRVILPSMAATPWQEQIAYYRARAAEYEVTSYPDVHAADRRGGAPRGRRGPPRAGAVARGRGPAGHPLRNRDGAPAPGRRRPPRPRDARPPGDDRPAPPAGHRRQRDLRHRRRLGLGTAAAVR